MIDALGLEQSAVEYKGNQAILFRRTYPELRDLIDRAQEIYGQNCPVARYKGDDHVYIFPSGAKIEFGHMNHPNDRFKYRGRQFAYEGWDELTLYPDDVAYRYLFSRLRSPQTRLKCYVRSTTNPDGPGHKWVKERWAIPNEGTDTCFKVEVQDEETGEVYNAPRRAGSRPGSGPGGGTGNTHGCRSCARSWAANIPAISVPTACSRRSGER